MATAQRLRVRKDALTTSAKAGAPSRAPKATKVSARPASEQVNVRVPSGLREEAESILSKVGLSMSEAMRLFLHRVVIERALPLRLDVPNEETAAAMRRAREVKTARFATFEDMIGAIEDEARRD